MSGQVAGQVRVLPFTGFAALPFLVLGIVATVAGALMTRLRSKKAVV